MRCIRDAKTTTKSNTFTTTSIMVYSEILTDQSNLVICKWQFNFAGAKCWRGIFEDLIMSRILG